MHTSLIRRLVVDAPRDRLITASDDKTVRIWQLPQARLLRTLRVPIGAGHEGQLFALAVSPDGRMVAAGGWTGWDWDGSACVYLFDVQSGELVRRVGGFKDAIGALAWSADGRYLAVGLQARAGLHVLRAGDYRIVASDVEYNDKIMDIDFDRAGTMAVVALDGMTRVYGRDLRIVGRVAIAGAAKPASVRFSPDGSLLAIGHADAPVVAVASARDLTLQFKTDTAALADQASFNTAVWSSDGEYLYAGGEYKGGGMNPLYRWGNRGRGALERIPLAAQRIGEIQQLPGGAIAFAAEDPAVGVLGPARQRAAYRGPDVVDFGGSHGALAVSADADVVRFPAAPGGGSPRTFVVEREGGQAHSAGERGVRAPVLQVAGMRIENWRDGLNPTLNGRELMLDDYERARCYAIAHDGQSLLLGTEWALRLYDGQARQRWRVQLPAVAWSVNVSGNGRLAVAALSDGTIRWYRMSDGREVLAYFPHGNGEDWIAWVPEGYYMSSVHGDNYVGWHLNRGREVTPDFFHAIQFERVLYRPDVVVDSFRGAVQGATRSLAGASPGAAFDIGRLREIAPPRLKLQVKNVADAESGRPRAALQVTGEKGGPTLREYTVFVNGIPVTPARERRLGEGESVRFRRDIEIELSSRDNEIRVESFNGISMGVAETRIALPAATRPVVEPGDLYILAIGANMFPKLPPSIYLAYAARDAEEVANRLAATGAGHFRQVHTKVVSDETATKPDRASILDTVRFVQQAQARDTVVIFLASHGISDKAGNYYFVPRDAIPADLEAVANGGQVETLLSWSVFFDALREAAGRRVLMVDTCQAKNIEGRFEVHSLMKRSAASRFSLVVAAKGDEESQEYAPARHGLFTYALLNALDLKSDANRDGLVTLKEIFEAAMPVVEKLRDRSIGPQTPQLLAPKVLEDSALFGTRRAYH
jgi:WD40 repeat protein